MGHEKQKTARQVVKGLIMDEGWKGLYRGLGPRFFSMSAWGTSMILTYEYLSKTLPSILLLFWSKQMLIWWSKMAKGLNHHCLLFSWILLSGSLDTNYTSVETWNSKKKFELAQTVSLITFLIIIYSFFQLLSI